MIDLENKKERDKLIDDYFNKSKECDIKEVYQAIVNSTGDLEYEVDKLKSIIKEVRKYIEENTKEGPIKDKRYFYSPEQANDILEILNEEEN